MQKNYSLSVDVHCNQTFKIVVNDFDTKRSVHCSWVHIVTELVVSGSQCNSTISGKKRVLSALICNCAKSTQGSSIFCGDNNIRTFTSEVV